MGPTPDFPDYPQQLDDGNRRLDLNVYNYVDTSGPSNDLADSSFSPGESPFSSDSQFSPGESPPPFLPPDKPRVPIQLCLRVHPSVFLRGWPGPIIQPVCISATLPWGATAASPSKRR